jgi:hypothetical protein
MPIRGRQRNLGRRCGRHSRHRNRRRSRIGRPGPGLGPYITDSFGPFAWLNYPRLKRKPCKVVQPL